MKRNAGGEDPDNQKISGKECLILVGIAITVISLLSKSSPFYPLNDWVDVNIFLSMGKAVAHGKVMYRDIYDQKGPLVYLIFAALSYISSSSFLGLYLLEIICAWIFLFYSYKTVRLYLEKNVLILMPLYAFFCYSTQSFMHGGSVEELCMPMVTCSLYLLLRALRYQNEILSLKDAFWNGIFIGIILWIKYSMLGFYIGYALVIVILYLKKRKIAYLFRIIGTVLLGIFISTIPILFYFGIHHAFKDLGTAYFYDNIMYYGDNSGFLESEITNFLTSYSRNPALTSLILAGVIFFAVAFPMEALAVSCCLIPAAISVYLKGSRYYSYLLTGFMPFSLIAAGRFVKRLRPKRHLKVGFALISVILCALLFRSSPNTYLFLKSKDTLPQYKLAKYIEAEEDHSLLNYGVLDVGLYTAADTVPTLKYFFRANIRLPEMYQEQDRYIQEGATNFVVTRNRELSSDKYQLIATENGYFEWHTFAYRLYKRT